MTWEIEKCMVSIVPSAGGDWNEIFSYEMLIHKMYFQSRQTRKEQYKP